MPLCMGCLNEIPAADSVCGVCGFNNAEKQTAPFLPFGTVLNNKYVVAKNLDTNGESTKYLSYDKISGTDTCFNEQIPVGSVSGQTKDVKTVLQFQELFLIALYCDYLMTFLGKLLYEDAADFSGTDYDDFHLIASLSNI